MQVGARWIWTLAAAVAVLVAGRADAFDIVFNGPSGYGVNTDTAANAEDAGIPILEVASLSTAASLNLQIPAPDVLSFQLASHPSVATPNTATSQWNVTNGGEDDLANTWLVFLNPVTYTPSQIGFELTAADGWVLFDVFVPMGKGGTDYFYPAIYLGGIGSGDAVDFLMHHLVGQALHHQNGKLVLPQYSVAALQGLPAPEPSSLVVLALGLALAAGAVRRNA